jgi:hypothetical protein
VSTATALQARLLSGLEAVHGRDVATVMNALMHTSGSGDELADMQRVLENLVRTDVVRMSMVRDASGRLMSLSKAESLEAIEDLRSGLRFKAGRWIDTRHARSGLDDPFPFIVRLNG